MNYLVEQEYMELKVTNILNPALFLNTIEGREIKHDCLHTIEQVYCSRTDLKDCPLGIQMWKCLWMVVVSCKIALRMP